MKFQICFIIVSWLIVCGCQRPTTFDAELVLTGGYIFDDTGLNFVAGKDIVVEEGIIKAIVPQGHYSYSDSTQILDLHNKYLVPGFIEMHAHLPSDTTIQEEVLLTYLSFGITTILNPAANYHSGIGLKQKINSKRIFGPGLYTAGKAINGPGILDGAPLWETVTSEKEAREQVREQVEAGVDFIKVYAHLAPELVKCVIDEAHHLNKKVIGHLGLTSWKAAANSGIDIIVHSSLGGPTWELVPDEYQAKFKSNFLPSINYPNDYDPSLFNEWLSLINFDGENAHELFSALGENKVVVDPNLVVYESIIFGNSLQTKERLKIKYAPEKLRTQWSADINPSTSSWSETDFEAVQKAWPKFLEFVKILHDKKIKITSGSDLGNPWITPGIGFHRELELLVQAGISSPEVIKIGTRNGAETLGIIDDVGTIEEGKIANIVVLEENPISDIASTKNISAIVFDGQFFWREELKKMRQSTIDGM